MPSIFFDCSMGAAGDMLQGALYELLDDASKKKFVDEMNNSGLPGVHLLAQPDVKRGIAGTHMKVEVNGMEEGEHHAHEHNHEHGEGQVHSHEHEHADGQVHSHEHEHVDGQVHSHEHEHDHTHAHHHASMSEVENIINSTGFSDTVKNNALEIYKIIAGAESKAHGKSVSEVHFHEVGMLDAIADVLGNCRLIEMLSPEHIYASPIRVGYGNVHCAHGIMPVPAPATGYILENVPIYAGDIRGEMCTPTGAAVLTYFVEKFEQMPTMCNTIIGYGTGRKDFEQANCVRAIFGNIFDTAKNAEKYGDNAGKSAENVSDEVLTDKVKDTESAGNSFMKEKIVELACNIDDMTGEAIGYAIDKLRDEGALDVYTISAMMKKSRPGIVLNVICKSADEERMALLMLRHTSSLGIRRYETERYVLDRGFEIKHTEHGDIRMKKSVGCGILKTKPEFDDVSAIAEQQNLPLDEIMRDIYR